MATEVHIVVAWGIVLILVWVIAATLLVIGLLKKNTVLRSAGFVILGLAVFVTPLAFYLDKSNASDMIITAILALLGGASITIGVIPFRSSPRKRP